MFIDNNTSATNRFLRWLHLPPLPKDIVDDLWQDAKVWERLLFTSGGLLKLRKCLYYIMSWVFDSEGRASLLPKASSPPLHLTNGQDLTPKSINQHDYTKAHQYLGLWNSPSLAMTANLHALSTKAKTYSKRLFKSRLDKHEVWLAYFACFVPAMTFTLVVSSFTAPNSLHSWASAGISPVRLPLAVLSTVALASATYSLNKALLSSNC
jgi:hypothetical protein